MNDVVKDFSAMQANNIFLGGVYFGYSSVTWYYTLQHLVATQKSIQPIIEFIRDNYIISDEVIKYFLGESNYYPEIRDEYVVLRKV